MTAYSSELYQLIVYSISSVKGTERDSEGERGSGVDGGD